MSQKATLNALVDFIESLDHAVSLRDIGKTGIPEYILRKSGPHYHMRLKNGYPNGVQGRNIPLAALIIAVADFYDALKSNRPYRKAFAHKTVCCMTQDAIGTKFSPDIMSAFSAIEYEPWRIHNELY
jgi:response regulator RpfG family c-di-GMP phosphodiesterase